MWQLVICCTFLGLVSIVIENPKSQWLTQDRISFSFSHVKFRRCAVLGWHAVSLCILVSLVAQVVKNLPAMQATKVQSLGWEWLPTPSCLWPQNYVNKAHILIDALGVQFSSVQSLSRVRLFATPWAAAQQASLSNTNSQSQPKLMSIELVMPSNHLILCFPLLLLPSIFPSIRVFSNESTLRMRWSKYWAFSFNIRPLSEHPGLISFRMDWLDPFAVQGTLKSLLQHHTSKPSILQHSAFFIVQLSHHTWLLEKP